MVDHSLTRWWRETDDDDDVGNIHDSVDYDKGEEITCLYAIFTDYSVRRQAVS